MHRASPSLSSFVDSATSRAQDDELYLSDNDSSAGCEDDLEDEGSAKYCYAYVQDRRPVYIDKIIHIRHERPNMVICEMTCALVCPFLRPETIPGFPWDPWYVFSHLFLPISF